MEQTINKIELCGNVGNVKFFESTSGKYTRFSIATNYVFSNKVNEAVVETSWHNIVAWEGKGITGIEKITKGMRLHVFGRVRQSKYVGADGQEKQSYEVVANKIILEDGSTEN